MAPRLVLNLIAASSLTPGLLMPTYTTESASSTRVDQWLDSQALSRTFSQQQQPVKGVKTDRVQPIALKPDMPTSPCPSRLTLIAKPELLGVGLPERTIAGASR